MNKLLLEQAESLTFLYYITKLTLNSKNPEPGEHHVMTNKIDYTTAIGIPIFKNYIWTSQAVSHVGTLFTLFNIPTATIE